jgi:hypothetical protein
MALETNVAPQTDANGNPLPAQGMAPGAAPAVPGIVAGAPDLATAVASAFMQHLAKNQPPPVSEVVAKQKAAAASAQPVDTNRPPASAPGSFADKLGSAYDNLSGSLSDAAHASDTKGGWLSGVANTLNARQQRLANAQKDAALLAKVQAETVAMHRNIYQQDQAIRDGAYKGNQTFVDQYKVNHDIEDSITHDDLMKRAQSDKDFVNKYFVRATGEEPMLDGNGLPKKDKDGNPVTSPTYTIITRATKDGSKDDKTVSADMAASMSKYLGSNMPANTKLTSDQFAALDGQLNLARNAVNILQNTNEKELSSEQTKILQPYLTDPTIQGAISHVPGSAYAGLLQYENNADAHIAQLQQQMAVAKDKKDQQGYDTAKAQIADLTAEKQKVQNFMSQAISPKQIERFDKESEEGIKWVDKVLHDPASLSGDKASSVIPQLQEALKTETDPGRKAKLTSAISAAETARDNYFHDMDRKAKADQMAKQGDPKAAAKELVSGNLTLADLKTRGTTADFILQATQEAHRLDPTYNPADEVNFEHVAKSPQAAVFFGSARSLLSKGGTLDQLNDWGNKIPDNGLPVLNTIDDWQNLARGKGPLAGYAALVLGAADDYGKVMGGGTASDSARDAALHLFAAAQTREQRMDAIRGTLGGVGSQYDARIGNNKFLQREYGSFARSGYAPESENKPAITTGKVNLNTQQQPQVHSMDVQRPKDLPTAVATQEFKNAKTGKVQLYWKDISGKPLRPVAEGELPKE